ncbi:MAG: hypothetical protein E5Y73_32320 [Mesorhizobium sp.]|nr:MAG: hypothetical protein E5Y73_32320 [Mesorhizobium sp.]TIP25232.1 MAG: hypothetical protein E5X67_25660 [Mesorhizobium sp.]
MGEVEIEEDIGSVYEVVLDALRPSDLLTGNLLTKLA